MRRALSGLALAVVVVLASTAGAHRFAPGLLLLSEAAPGVFSVSWHPPPDGEQGAAELRPVLPAGCRPAPAPADSSDGGPDAIAGPPARIDCGAAGLSGATLALAGEGAGEVVVEVRLLGGRSVGGVLRGAGDALTLPGAAAAPAGAVLRGYLRLGVVHILTGWDHLLLLLALLLLVGRATSLVAALSAFTAAHSLTLALAVLGVVQVPAAPVEALIALSIALLAAELCRGPGRTLAGRRPALVAFLFGLLHGLGFAGALGEAGLPPQRVPLALLGFNLGVEGGQLLFVACLWLPAAALRRRGALAGPAYAMGALAMAWTIERLALLGSS